MANQGEGCHNSRCSFQHFLDPGWEPIARAWFNALQDALQSTSSDNEAARAVRRLSTVLMPPLARAALPDPLLASPAPPRNTQYGSPAPLRNTQYEAPRQHTDTDRGRHSQQGSSYSNTPQHRHPLEGKTANFQASGNSAQNRPAPRDLLQRAPNGSATGVRFNDRDRRSQPPAAKSHRADNFDRSQNGAPLPRAAGGNSRQGDHLHKPPGASLSHVGDLELEDSHEQSAPDFSDQHAPARDEIADDDYYGGHNSGENHYGDRHFEE